MLRRPRGVQTSGSCSTNETTSQTSSWQIQRRLRHRIRTSLPAQGASIISTIQDRGYVWKKGSALVPSFTAFAVITLLEQHFPDLVSTRPASEDSYLACIRPEQIEVTPSETGAAVVRSTLPPRV